MGGEYVHLFNIVLWQIAVVHKSQSIFKTAQNDTFIISLYFLGHCFPWNRVMTGGCRKSRSMWLVLNITEIFVDVLWAPGWTRAVWQEQNWLYFPVHVICFLYQCTLFQSNEISTSATTLSRPAFWMFCLTQTYAWHYVGCVMLNHNHKAIKNTIVYLLFD